MATLTNIMWESYQIFSQLTDCLDQQKSKIVKEEGDEKAEANERGRQKKGVG